jgi:lysophospholipid acyltransferase (LPLAT)-like uncharacterized protein
VAHRVLLARGMRTVRGSSSRLGREAATALVDVLRAGHDVGITPDGPRGPCYELKPGGVIVARRTRAPALLVGAEFTSAWRVRSWDRFYVPRPFSRVRMRCEVLLPEQLADRDAGVALMRERLLALNPDSDGRYTEPTFKTSARARSWPPTARRSPRPRSRSGR